MNLNGRELKLSLLVVDIVAVFCVVYSFVVYLSIVLLFPIYISQNSCYKLQHQVRALAVKTRLYFEYYYYYYYY